MNTYFTVFLYSISPILGFIVLTDHKLNLTEIAIENSQIYSKPKLQAMHRKNYPGSNNNVIIDSQFKVHKLDRSSYAADDKKRNEILNSHFQLSNLKPNVDMVGVVKIPESGILREYRPQKLQKLTTAADQLQKNSVTRRERDKKSKQIYQSHANSVVKTSHYGQVGDIINFLRNNLDVVPPLRAQTRSPKYFHRGLRPEIENTLLFQVSSPLKYRDHKVVGKPHQKQPYVDLIERNQQKFSRNSKSKVVGGHPRLLNSSGFSGWIRRLALKKYPVCSN